HDCGYLHPSCGVQISAITGAVKAVDPGLAGIGEDRVAFSGYPCGCTEVRMSPLDHEHPVSPERVAAARAGVLPAGEAGRLAGLLGMLADPVRSRILFALSAAGELCVGDLALALEVTEDQVSYALKMLRLAGMVSFRKDGRMVFYRLSDGFPHP